MSTATSVLNRAAIVAALATTILLTACSGAVKEPFVSDPLQRERDFSRRGADAFRKGRYDRAVALYEEALRISRAIEYLDGTAVNTINLAAIYRALGEREKALSLLAEILSNEPVLYEPAYQSEAAYVSALIHLDASEYPRAGDLARKSRDLCNAAGCGEAGKIINLLTRIAALENRRDNALRLAAEALELNRQAGNLRESANSLRLLADLRLAMREWEEAGRLYGEALEIDKELGLSEKISLDLTGRGNVLAGQNRGREALPYFERALAVSRAAGDDKGADRAAAAINEVKGLR